MLSAFVKKILFLCPLFLSIFIGSAHAIVINGDLSDWGIAPAGYGDPDWQPHPGIYYVTEDQNPAVNFLSPGWGGQRFDVEGIYFTRDDLLAYFAVISGFPLEGRSEGGKDYDAGDFIFDFENDGTFEFGLETTGDRAGSVIGGLYGNPSWAWPEFSTCGPYNLLSGNYLGQGLFSYNNTTYVDDGHYVFEFSIPINLFGSYWASLGEIPEFAGQWTMSCGNDCLKLHVPFVPSTPEPSTLFLLASGLGLFLSRKRFPV